MMNWDFLRSKYAMSGEIAQLKVRAKQVEAKLAVAEEHIKQIIRANDGMGEDAFYAAIDAAQSFLTTSPTGLVAVRHEPLKLLLAEGNCCEDFHTHKEEGILKKAWEELIKSI